MAKGGRRNILGLTGLCAMHFTPSHHPPLHRPSLDESPQLQALEAEPKQDSECIQDLVLCTVEAGERDCFLSTYYVSSPGMGI